MQSGKLTSSEIPGRDTVAGRGIMAMGVSSSELVCEGLVSAET